MQAQGVKGHVSLHGRVLILPAPETSGWQRWLLVRRSLDEGLDGAQANALLRQARTSRDSLRNYAIIQVLLQTGMWLDECSQLLLDDIELGERSGWVTIRQGKGNKARVIPLNASLRLASRSQGKWRL